MLLIASYVLLTLEGNDGQIRSGTTYVVLNVIESFVLVTGVALIFAATGTLNMAVLPERLAALPDGIRLGLNLLLLIAFGLKAAVFPLFSWLPDSYPAAPSPVSAVFAGLLTKVGVYAIVRTQTLLFPDTNRELLLIIAGLTMVIGVLGAIAQSDMKRILSFHIISQIGYMIMGVALGGVAAITATIFYMLHHIPVKTSLFLVEGIVERETGSSTLGSVSGSGSPVGAAGGAVPDPGVQPRRAAAVLRVPRQDRRGHRRTRAAVVVDRGCGPGGVADDPRVDAQDLDWRVLGRTGPDARRRRSRRDPAQASADVGRDDVGRDTHAADRPVRRAALPVLRACRDGRHRRRCLPVGGPAVNRLLPTAFVLIVWLALWGEVSVVNVASGMLVVAILALLFRPTPREHTLHPLALVRLLAVFVWRLLSSSATVVLTVLAPTPARLRSGVVGVALSHPSRLVATIVADAISLTPGTLTLEARYAGDEDGGGDATEGTPPVLYIHVLGLADADGDPR